MRPPARLLAAVLLACTSPAFAQPAAMVKMATPPTIDGDPGDWAGIQAEQAINGRLGPAGSFKLGYDAANVYALIRVTDATPLKNNSTIFQELLKGGDALSLCFGPTDGKFIYHRVMVAQIAGKNEIIDLRPHWTDRTHAYTYFTAAGGKVDMDSVVRLQDEGAQAALAPAPGGYLAEVKIPWKVLGIQPAAGLTVPFDLQVIYSDPAGTTNVDTNWWHSSGGGSFTTTDLATEARLYPETWGEAQLFEQDPGPPAQRAAAAADPAFTPRGLPITFTLPRACKVSVVIKDKNGWIARELLRVHPLPAGKHTIYWDGRDRWGAIEPPGQYTYLIGCFDGMKTKFAASAGNSAFPPYRTADGLGSIGGMHAGPMAVAGGDGQTIYQLNAGEEGQQSLRKFDIATGKSLWFHSVGTFGMGEAVATDETSAYMIYSANDTAYFVRMDPATGRNLSLGDKRTPVTLGKGMQADGLAIIGSKAYFPVTKQNRIGVLNLATGELEKDIPLDAPRGLCKTADGALLVCQKQSVLRLNPQTGIATPLLTGFEAAASVAVDAAGQIYVSDLGSVQQIKKFSSEGKLLATFGVPGGRGLTAVPYNPNAFRNVTNLTIGPDGNLWFVEPYEAPRRLARFTTGGKWLQDIYGPARCGVTVGFDLDDVSSIWYHGEPGEKGQFINAKVDYAAYAQSPDGAKGFKVESIWRLAPGEGGKPAKSEMMAAPATAGYSRATVFTATNGKRYFWTTGGARCGLWLWEDAKWQPVAAVGGGKDEPHYWADANGDGLVEPEETSTDPVDSTWGGIGRDLTLYGINGSIKPASASPRGVPTYLGGQVTPYLKGTYPTIGNYFDVQAYNAQMCPGTSDNSLYFNASNGPHQNRDFWDRASENRIVKIKDGRIEWMVGHHDGTLAHDGDQIIGFGIAGETDGVVLAADVGTNFVGYTTDGLALGWALTDENGRPAQVGPNAIYVENAAPGVFIKDPKTGRHLLLSHTSEDARVLEVTGVFGNDITRITGPLTLTAPEPRPTETATATTRIPYATWTKSIYEVWRPTNVDGYDYEWPSDIPVIPIRDGKTTVGEIRLRRDAGNLCIFADVLDAAPFPAGPITFGTSGGVELLLGPAGINAAGKRPSAGDTRLFLTATRDQSGQLLGQCLACKPGSEAVPPSSELSVLASTGKPRDKGTLKPTDLSAGLAAVPGAMIKVRERFDRQGYVIEAEVPIALMPELARRQSITFWHAGGNDMGILSREVRSDLLPVKINAAIWKGSQRLSWRADGFAGSDPRVMDPSNWAVASDPLRIALTSASEAAKPPALRHEITIPSSFGYGSGPKVRVKSALAAGGWFDENGLQFLTTTSIAGFKMAAAPGGGEPIQGYNRTARLDLTALGISNLQSRGQRANGPGKPSTATVDVDFPAGQSAKLHILWGGYTDNSEAGASLKLTDTTDGAVLDSSKIPDLAYRARFNGPCEIRESIFTLSGKRSLQIEVADNGSAQRAYLMGLWLEPVQQTSFELGSMVNLAAYTGSELSTIKRVEFFAGDQKIGEATQAPFAFTWKPAKAGSFPVTVRSTDDLGATGTSEPINLKVDPKTK